VRAVAVVEFRAGKPARDLTQQLRDLQGSRERRVSR
jgi:hypothetical protein